MLYRNNRYLLRLSTSLYTQPMGCPSPAELPGRLVLQVDPVHGRVGLCRILSFTRTFTAKVRVGAPKNNKTLRLSVNDLTNYTFRLLI